MPKRKRLKTNIDNSTKKKKKSSNIFNYKIYLEKSGEVDNLYNEYKQLKEEFKEFHYKENKGIKPLFSNYFTSFNKYNNLLVEIDGITEYNDLVAIYPCHVSNENDIPDSYYNYIQEVLNILDLNKCYIFVYYYNIYSSRSELRRNSKFESYRFGNINNSRKMWYINSFKNYVINKVSKTINIFNKSIKKRETLELSNEWISPSKTRNYALNDTFLDYCKEYNVTDIKNTPRKILRNKNRLIKTRDLNTRKGFLGKQLRDGNKFEEYIISLIKHKFPDKFIKICEPYQASDKLYYNKTISKMREGVPFIYQAVLRSYKHKVYGCADLIIRSDWLNRLIDVDVIDNNISFISGLTGGFHYVVVDIKHHTLDFNVDKNTIKNGNQSVRVFKIQIALYNISLGEMQNYTPSCSYILGKGWKESRKVNKEKQERRSNNPLNRLGVINFKDMDKKYIKESLDAIAWLKKLRDSTDWTHNPPSNNYLYPNMCNTQGDPKYNKVKKQMANRLNELTSIYKVGINNRNNAFEKNIKSYKDPRCTASILGIKGSKTEKQVTEILNINRNCGKLINVSKIKNIYKENEDWRDDTVATIFVDFETILKVLLNPVGDLQYERDFIFMIGIGWKTPNSNEWNYKCLKTNEIDLIEEIRILQEMGDIIYDIEQKYGLNMVCHWGNIEKTMYNKINKLYGNIFRQIKWFDMCDFFKNNCIAIKGAKNYKLKEVTNSMYNNGMINIKWDTNCTNGLDASYNAYRMYSDENINTPEFADIIRYNEIDCKSIFAIINYLRDNH